MTYYETMRETDEMIMFQKLRKQGKEKDREEWKKRKPWRKIQREKQKTKYSDLL